jgi:hypothetical protein
MLRIRHRLQAALARKRALTLPNESCYGPGSVIGSRLTNVALER